MANKNKVFGTKDRPRLVVYRSLRYMHAQLIDDTSHQVIVGLMDNSSDVKGELKKAKTKTERAAIVGEILAQKAKDKKIKKVVFDRNGYIYHGRVKALAEGARKGGLEF